LSSNITFGSVCSGIEASQVAFKSFGFKQLWSSEIDEFPSKILKEHYPNVPNVGDMINIPDLIKNKIIDAPDLLCGGTPCQAFSLAGLKKGLHDERGLLTMKFIEIANSIDKIRIEKGEKESIVLWENVEGVLSDKSNAFGNFLAGLAGLDKEIKVSKWSKSGYLSGITRNIAWRVLDSKFFGLPQQRKRLFVIAGGKDFNPDHVLFEIDNKDVTIALKIKEDKIETLNLFNTEIKNKKAKKIFFKNNIKCEVFRNYSDCLYSAYGTKWNGNAASYNGSLFVSENDRLRRFNPLECERLMGFEDNYTKIDGYSNTARYKALGNSWAVPVVKWIGNQIHQYKNSSSSQNFSEWKKLLKAEKHKDYFLYLLNKIEKISSIKFLNTSASPNNSLDYDIKSIIEPGYTPENLYISLKALEGIIRRKEKRKIKMNPELEKIMKKALSDNKSKPTIVEKETV